VTGRAGPGRPGRGHARRPRHGLLATRVAVTAEVLLDVGRNAFAVPAAAAAEHLPLTADVPEGLDLGVGALDGRATGGHRVVLVAADLAQFLRAPIGVLLLDRGQQGLGGNRAVRRRGLSAGRRGRAGGT